MKDSKKLIKTSIVASFHDNPILSIKKLRKSVKIRLSDNENIFTDELFDKVLEKLKRKGKLITEGDKLKLKSDDNMIIETSNDSCKIMNNESDYQVDETNVIDHVNELSSGDNKNHTKLLSQVKEGDVTILLFYAYCTPQMTRSEQDNAIAFCYSTLSENGVTGRLRVGREGFNGTLTGKHGAIRVFTDALRTQYPAIFGETDFKYVDGQPSNQMLKGLKVWPVTEIVTYGFDPKLAPLEMTGNHLKPHEFHEAMKHPNAVMIDVRNFNETLIGKFDPPVKTEKGESVVLDPCMRRSTEFPEWVAKNKHKLEGKKVLMYCTGGVRCERASAYIRNLGIEDVNQLEGGIHRYLEAYKEDGGFWVGKNYTFDKRFAHGAENAEVISKCVYCKEPWERYQAQSKCYVCAMEVLLCRTCQRMKPAVPKDKLFCPLCENLTNKKPQKRFQAEKDSFG